jgi:hypothetical protein
LMILRERWLRAFMPLSLKRSIINSDVLLSWKRGRVWWIWSYVLAWFSRKDLMKESWRYCVLHKIELIS